MFVPGKIYRTDFEYIRIYHKSDNRFYLFFPTEDILMFLYKKDYRQEYRQYYFLYKKDIVFMEERIGRNFIPSVFEEVK